MEAKGLTLPDIFPLLLHGAAGRRDDGEDAEDEQDRDRQDDFDVNLSLRQTIGDLVAEVFATSGGR